MFGLTFQAVCQFSSEKMRSKNTKSARILKSVATQFLDKIRGLVFNNTLSPYIKSPVSVVINFEFQRG